MLHPNRPTTIHKLLALLLIFATFSTLLPSMLPTALANETIYFTAINDEMLPFNLSTMAAWIDGQLYVPYTVFDKESSGTDMGTNATHSSAQGTVTVYNLGNSLTFDLSTGHCKDQRTGISYPYKAVYRNGIVFLPVAGVCNFFGLTYTYQKTDYGYLLRLKGSHVVLSDARFIDAAKNLMSSMVKEYQQQTTTQPTTTVTPEVSVTPEDPAPDLEETTEEETIEEEEELTETPLIFAVDMIDYNVRLPELLSNAGISAIFFFTPEQLENQGDLMRSLLGKGHSIGLEVTGDSLDEVKSQITTGNQLLLQQTRSSTQILSTGAQWKHDLEVEGYHLWQGGEAKAISSANNVLNTLSPNGTLQYLTLEQTEATGENFLLFLRLLTEEGYIPLVPLENLL